MLIQCTKKLLDELKIKPSEPIEEKPLFSWHANLVIINRRKTMILANDKNRYVIVLNGLKAKDFKKTDEIIVEAIRETFMDECIKDEIIDDFINQSGKIVYSKTKDRTLTARLNKSCEAVCIFSDALSNDSIFQTSLSRRASRFVVGNGDKEYIEPYEELFKDFETIANKPILSCKCFVMKVTLSLENYDVWRRLKVPANMTFCELHKIIQLAFNWKNYHLHEFIIFDKKASGSKYSYDGYIDHPAYNRAGYEPIAELVSSSSDLEYSDEQIEMKLENNIRLSEYLPEHKMIKYIYDYGDNWQHYIEIEEVHEDYDKNYPVCLSGNGNTPPEDVGGEGGYENFLHVLSDADNPEHKSYLVWAEGQGYREFDIDMVNNRLKYL